MNNNRPLKLSEASEYSGIAKSTLQRYDYDGVLTARRTKTNRRYYLTSDLDEFLQRKSENIVSKKKTVAYARVSSHGQKDDLQRQVDYVKNWAEESGFKNIEVLTDIGSGLNYKRRNWNKILYSEDYDTVIVAHKDRFVRFGFEWFRDFLLSKNVKLIIINQISEDSPEKELVEDLVSIIQVFSSRLYGLRKYEHKITHDKELQEVNDSG